MAEFAVNFKLTPTLDVAALNGKLGTIKSTLATALGGESFKGLKEATNGMSGAFNNLQTSANGMVNNLRNSLALLTVAGETGSKEFKDLTAQLKQSEAEVRKLDAAYTAVGGNAGQTAGSVMSKLATAGLAGQAIQQVSSSINELTQVGMQYEDGMAAVSAITGFAGKDLDKLGESARGLAKNFGGSANDQLKSFQGILSKLGPEMAGDAKSLELLANNVNVLSKASGDDAATSMNAIVDSMLQMGLASGTPAEIAKNSTDVINALAASAQVGAAEIPQVSAALLQAGVAAKGAGLDIVDANAALQVLALGGKTGSEAGIALRNVLGLMQKNSKEADSAMQNMGFSLKDLGTTLNEQGLPAALEKVKTGLSTLGSQSERNATLMQIFGSENSAAVGIMMDNLPSFAKFGDGIKAGMEGAGSAAEQAKTRMATSSEGMSRLKANFDDLLISFQQSVGPAFSTITGFAAQVAPTIMSISMIGSALPTEKIGKYVKEAGGISGAFKSGVKSAGEFAKSTGTMFVDGAKGIGEYVRNAGGVGPVFASIGTSIWGAVKAAGAFAMTPVGAVIIGLAAVTAGVAYMAGAFDQSAASRLKDNEATVEYTNNMIANNKSQQAEEQKKMDLISRYETLQKKQVTSNDEVIKKERELDEMRTQLNNKYPQTIDLTKDHVYNLEKLKEATGLVGLDTSKFTEENKNLAREFENLSSKTTKTTAEKTRLQEVTAKLSKIFPNAQLGTKSLSEEMKFLKNNVGLSSQEINKLQTDLQGYSNNLAKLTQQNANLKFWNAKEELQSSFDFWTGNKVKWSKEAEAMAQDIAKATNPKELDIAYKKWTENIDKNSGALGKEENKMRTGLESMKNSWLNYLNVFATKPVDAKATDVKPEIDALDKVSKEKKKKAIEERDLSAETFRIKQANKKLEISAEAAINDDAYKNDLEQLKLKHEGELQDIKQNIKDKQTAYDKAREDSKNKEAAQIKEQIGLLQDQSELRIAVQQTELNDLAEKFIKSNQKVYADLEKSKNDNAKRQLDLLKSIDKPSIQILADRLELEKQMIAANNAEETQSYLSKNDNYVKATARMYDVLKQYGDKYQKINIAELIKNQDFSSIADQQVVDALKTFSDVTNSIIVGDTYLNGKRQQSNIALNRLIQENTFATRDIQIQAITDLNKFEYESRKLSLDKTLAKELDSIGNNLALRRQAFANYARGISDAENQLIINSSASWQKSSINLMNSFNLAFASVKPIDNSAAIKEQKKILAGYDDELKALEEQRLNNQINSDEFIRQQDAILAKKVETNAKLSELDATYSTLFKQTMSQAMSNYLETINKTLAQDLEAWKTNIAAKNLAEENSHKTLAQLTQNLASGNFKAAAGDTANLKQNIDDKTAYSQQANSALYDSLSQTAQIFGATTVKMIADGNSLVKSMVMGALAGAKAIVPILIVRLLGEEFATKSLAGVATAGLMAGVLYSALSVAEGAVSKMQFRTGGYTGNLPENAEAGTVHGQEYVLNAKATRVNDMKALDFSNKTGKSIREYFKNDPSFIDEIKRTELTKVHIKEFISTEKHSIEVNKQLVRDLINEDRANNQAQMQVIEQNRKLDQLIQLTSEGNYKRTTTNKVHIAAEFDTQRLVKLQQVYKMNSLARS